MASSLQLRSFTIFLSLRVVLSLSNPFHSTHGDLDESLLQSINCHRESLSLLALRTHHKASCLATEIAIKFKGKPCTNTDTDTDTATPADKYRKILKKCGIAVDTTRDGVILPICAPRLIANYLVCTNCKPSVYSEFLRSSDYYGAGVGLAYNWTVIVLSTNTSAGSFSSSAPAAAALVSVNVAGLSHNFLFFVFVVAVLVF